MNSRARQGLLFATAAAMVILGVLMAGTKGDPLNLLMVWMMPVCAVPPVLCTPDDPVNAAWMYKVTGDAEIGGMAKQRDLSRAGGTSL
ncbi:MAG: hypothetical protein ACI9EF_001009 [Pseudohongiellaceae bacterium]|jgi:hypothetical protein